MSRILTLFVVLILLGACSAPKKKPLISGLQWGGEGSRLVVHPVCDDSTWSDTLFIDHLGEFTWSRDSIVPGFYRLEKSPDAGLTFFLEPGSEVFVDAQYLDYPLQTVVKGSDIALDVLRLEKNTRDWQAEIAALAKQVSYPGWIPSLENRQALKTAFDSIRYIYRDTAVSISANPLVMFLALHQSAGNNNLFDPWTDRDHFLRADTALLPHRSCREIQKFAMKVDTLRRFQRQEALMKPGSRFPMLSFPNASGDTVSLARFKGIPVYVEVWRPGKEEVIGIHARTVSVLNRYRRNELEVYLIGLDTVPSLWKENIRSQNLYYNNVIDLRGMNSPLLKELGIVQLPSNFLVDGDGVVMAKNIWGAQLTQGIDLILGK